MLSRRTVLKAAAFTPRPAFSAQLTSRASAC